MNCKVCFFVYSCSSIWDRHGRLRRHSVWLVNNNYVLQIICIYFCDIKMFRIIKSLVYCKTRSMISCLAGREDVLAVDIHRHICEDLMQWIHWISWIHWNSLNSLDEVVRPKKFHDELRSGRPFHKKLFDYCSRCESSWGIHNKGWDIISRGMFSITHPTLQSTSLLVDFVPRNFHLFQYFKNDLGRKHFHQIRLILWPY